jgi:tRNA isopentenyl-2-thiomethyl-A-37 hydroxylase MiaE
MAKRLTLDSWIADIMSDGEKDGPIAALILLHVREGKDTELDKIRFTGAKQWTASELALRFRSRAEGYAQDLPGAQTFNILAFYRTSADGPVATEPEARHPFVLQGEGVASSGILTTESPDQKGQAQQGMRHIEVVFAENLRMTRTLLDRYDSTLSALAEQNRVLNREQIESSKLIREMYLQARGEEHRMQLEEKKAEQMASLMDGLMKYAPALLNTITGREVFPQPTADSALVEALIQATTPEMVQALATVLPPQTMGLLASRLEKGLEARMQAQNSAASALSTALTGEADVAGALMS